MKIDLAVWTAVNGYDWQPGSVYSPKELAGYKDEIGPLVPDTLPLGGLFLKDGKAVFYRVQIAERMDSRGRGAIYCVLGTVPEDKAKEIDFAFVFNSAEMEQPQKPFPTAIEYNAELREFKLPLGRAAFDEKRFTGVETFFELGGWCEEAKGGKLNVRITGNIDAPLFTVNYRPHVEPMAVPPEPSPPPSRRQAGGCVESVKPSRNSFLNGFVVGAIFGVVITTIVAWLFWPSEKESLEGRASADKSISVSQNNPHPSVKFQQAAAEQTEQHKESTRMCPKCAGRGAVKSLWERKPTTCTYCSGMGYVQE